MARCSAAAPRSTSPSTELRFSFPMSDRNGCICAGSPVSKASETALGWLKGDRPLRRAESSLTWYRASLFPAYVSRTVALSLEKSLEVPASRARAGTEDDVDDEGNIAVKIQGRRVAQVQ